MIDLNIFPVAWYAITWSKELGKKPIRVRLLGKDYVLFRDDKGIVRCLNAYCPHRGADLSLGSCQDGQLECAYHGWRFDGQGKCLKIPAHPNKEVPALAHARSYPVREAASLIWLYPQQVDDEKKLPELGLFQDLSDDQYVFTPTMVTWQAHVTRVVESILDMTHLHFVHRKTIGRFMKPTLDKFSFTVEDNNWDIHVDSAHIEYIFPQHMILRRTWGGSRSFINYYCFTPIDENLSKVFCLTGRNFARYIPGMNKFFMKYNLKIFNEDKPIVESQNPISIPEMMQMEVHVDSDGPQVRFRQRWYQFLLNKTEPRIDIHEQRLNVLRN